jgi:hypothetical protein
MKKSVITHPGNAHFDEVMAISLLLATHPDENFQIERRDPGQKELDNPDVWVIDTGERYEPELHNFDHHQNLELDASFVLVADYLGLSKKLQWLPWWEYRNIMDRFGPFKAGEKYGVRDSTPLHSPIESWLLEMFANSPLLVQHLLFLYGKSMLERAEKTERGVRFWSKCRREKIKNHIVLIGLTEHSIGVQEFNRRSEFPASVCINFDKRGQGWRILRMNDNLSIDFNRIADCVQIKFAHKSGFLAKTDKRYPIDEILSLVEKAICDQEN